MTASIKPTKSTFFFGIRDMTSSESAGVVVRALKDLDGAATVRVNLPMRCLEIETTRSEHFDLSDAISKAGFKPVRQWPSELMSPESEQPAPRLRRWNLPAAFR